MRATKGPRPWSRLGDDELVALAVSGNEEAQHQLFSRFQRLVSLLASTVASQRVAEEEAVQVAQVALWTAAQGYLPGAGASFPTYATRCIQNALISLLREGSALKNQPFNLSANAVDSDGHDSHCEVSAAVGDCGLASEYQYPQEEADFEATVRLLAKALFDQLTARERAVLVRYLRGETYLQIAGSLDISYKAVDGAVQRTRKKAQNHHF